MCGISGIWNLNEQKLSLESLKRFTDTMIHRGPDGSGYNLYLSETLGLGHRRLSILDLTEMGKQPFSYLDTLHITFNGEIYNFIELRKELSAQGYSFRTESDTEVVLAAYHCFGKDCLMKFNGMWAFAIWDERNNELFVARDRFGVKPLHYCYLPGKLFAFASETIAFKNLDGFKRSFDESHLSLAVQNPNLIEATGRTIFRDLNQLLPGCSIQLKSTSAPVIKKWWDTADHIHTTPAKYEDQVVEFRELFFDACKIRMRSDVPIASALSGGLDSSSVYCTLQYFNNHPSQLERLPARWQKAFVATFPGTDVDERNYAEEVLNYTKGEAW
jgi:asparagine synthase (glutamine-hydrolysing)